MLKFRKDIGHAVIKPASEVSAGTCGSWVIIYTAGKKGIKRGGKISFGIPHGFSMPQVDNPYMHGYCTAEYSRKDVSLVLRCTRDTSNKLDYKSGWYGSINTGVMVHVCEGALRPFDRIIFNYGNEAIGSPGSISRTMEGPSVFTILVCDEDSQSDKAHFCFLENPPVLQVVSREPRKLQVVMPSITRVSEKFNACITLKDEFENTSDVNNARLTVVGEGVLKGTDERISLSGKADRMEITPQSAGIGRLKLKNGQAGKITIESNPVMVRNENHRYNLYWGDLHCHSFVSDGLNSPSHLYKYARDIDRADFAAITDHGYMSDEGWDECMEAAGEYNKNNGFVAFTGFEHSAPGIHRNVYYKADRGKLIRTKHEEDNLFAQVMGYENGDEYKGKYPAVGTTEDLFKKLNPEKSLVIPHLHRMDWENHNPQFENLVEIYSNWGNREYSGCKYASVSGTRLIDTVQYALGLGYKLGFVGGGDGHGGRPGKDFWLRVRGARPGGITAIYSEELTRESLWEALKSRRCYATTGKRIIVRFGLNEYMMGEEAVLDSPDTVRELKIEIYGTCTLERVTIVKNNTDAAVEKTESDEVKFDWIDRKKACEGDYYYLRVEQSDGAMAWSSPIWVNIK